MKYKRLIYGGIFTASLLLNCLVVAEDNMKIDFSESYGNGIAVEKDGKPQLNRVQINKIRVDTIITIENPFGAPGTKNITTYYNVLFKSCLTHTGQQYFIPLLATEEPLCEVDNPAALSHSIVSGAAPDRVQLYTATADHLAITYFVLNLAPLGLMQDLPLSSQACANLQVRAIHALTQQPIPFAQVTLGTITHPTNADGFIQIDNLLANRVLLGVAQDGFQTHWQEVNLTCEHDNRLDMPLSPSPPPKSLRIILDWTNEQLDLDAHLVGPDPGLPETYFNPPDRFHLYFGNKSVDCVEKYCMAEIHYLDEFTESKPETITLLPPTGSQVLRPGTYRVVIHQFRGSGSLIEAGVTVRLQIEGQPEQIFTPPPLAQATGELAGNRMDIWRPFKFEVKNDGSVVVSPPKKDYSTGVNPSEVN